MTSTNPQPSVREAVARVIDPHYWAHWDLISPRKREALNPPSLTKADQIIALVLRADPLVEKLRGALQQAEDWFREYADLHRAKCSADGDAKAQTNTDRADFCAREALALPDGGGSAREPALSDDGGDQCSLATAPQLIATAPRDGQWIIGWRENFRPFPTRWHPASAPGGLGSGWWGGEPTHWLPFPTEQHFEEPAK